MTALTTETVCLGLQGKCKRIVAPVFQAPAPTRGPSRSNDLQSDGDYATVTICLINRERPLDTLERLSIARRDPCAKFPASLVIDPKMGFWRSHETLTRGHCWQACNRGTYNYGKQVGHIPGKPEDIHLDCFVSRRDQAQWKKVRVIFLALARKNFFALKPAFGGSFGRPRRAGFSEADHEVITRRVWFP
eukprot:1180137-Prorocentrum_minimum.AAC.1